MINKIISVVCAAILVVSSLSGCSQDLDGTLKRGDVLTVFNYGEYLEPEMLELFTRETGIEVKYEEASTPEEMYTKYKSGGISYDVLCTSDYMVQRLIEEGEAQKIDFSLMPNAANIGQRFWDMTKAFDPNNSYALPYFWGTIGILYDTTKVKGPVDSWDVLFNGDYAGDIIMQDSMRDTFMITLKYLKYSLNTDDEYEIREAGNVLKQQKPDVQAYLVDEARDEVVAGNAAMAVVYSGEAYLGKEFNPDLEYVIPKEGSNLWIDSWIITKNCTNTDAAMKFLDFLCRKDVAQADFEYIYYSTPNEAVIESMDEDLKNNPAVMPTDESLENCEVCTQFDPKVTELYYDLWKELKAL